MIRNPYLIHIIFKCVVQRTSRCPCACGGRSFGLEKSAGCSSLISTSTPAPAVSWACLGLVATPELALPAPSSLCDDRGSSFGLPSVPETVDDDAADAAAAAEDVDGVASSTGVAEDAVAEDAGAEDPVVAFESSVSFLIPAGVTLLLLALLRAGEALSLGVLLAFRVEDSVRPSGESTSIFVLSSTKNGKAI